MRRFLTGLIFRGQSCGPIEAANSSSFEWLGIVWHYYRKKGQSTSKQGKLDGVISLTCYLKLDAIVA